MATIELDMVEGASASHHVIQGWGITRLAVIRDMEQTSGNWDTGKFFAHALNLLIAQIGDRGSTYMVGGVPTYLEQFVPESVTPTEVRIRVIYKGYPLSQYEFSACLSQVESNLDVNGDLITVQYTYPSSYLLDPRKAGQTITQGGMVSRPIPEPVFTVKFIITNGMVLPIDLMSYFISLVGSVNQNTYTVGTLVGVAKTWLVTESRGVSRDGGASYEATWTIQYRKDTWDPLVIFINPDDGKPPHDLVSGTGYKRPRIPPLVDFPTFSFGPN